MKLGMSITLLCAWLFTVSQQGDQVRIFLSGKGVEIDHIEDAAFDVKDQAQKVVRKVSNTTKKQDKAELSTNLHN